MDVPETVPPRVFISYSHDSAEHQGRILGLADRLRKDGIDAIIDQYAHAPTDGWPMWMEAQIERADFVLLVCTDIYLRRVQQREQPGKGRGVLWEAKLIYNHLYTTDFTVQKFIPVLFKGGRPEHIPMPLRTMTHYSLDAAEGYEYLYRFLTGQMGHSIPELGNLKSLPSMNAQSYPASLGFHPVLHKPNGLDQRNRRAMLGRVRQDWIGGVLKQSLYRVARIQLTLQMKTDAVEQPLNAVVQVPNRIPTILKPGNPIANVFDEHGHALLILGEPGTGKTTLLLELAAELLDRAERDDTYPIPVVFNLSSWSLQRERLEQWLMTELNERNDVPKRLAQHWVNGEQIIPLLDGLDEVDVRHRAACVDAVNDFRRNHGLLPIAVCSRSADYDALGVQLRMRCAVLVQPLTTTQVRDFLDQSGAELSRLRAAVDADATLDELLHTPLMLWVAILTYRDPSVSLCRETSASARNTLFGKFVTVMLQRRSPELQYSQAKTMRWLAELACMLMDYKQTIFHLEDLSKKWSLGKTKVPALGISIAFFGLSVSIGMLIGGLVGVHVAFYTLLNEGPQGGLLSFLVLLAILGLSSGFVGGTIGAVVGSIGGTVYMLMELRPTETLRFTVSGRLSSVIRLGAVGSVVGLSFGFIGQLIYGVLVEPSEYSDVKFDLDFGNALLRAIFAGVVCGLLFGVSAALITAVTGEAVDARRRPNQGTHTSIAYSFVALVGGWVLGECLFGYGVKRQLIVGLQLGLLCWLFAGGLFAMTHVVVRLVSWASGSTPLNYVRFLDFASERLFLRKVGGGYIFTHRALMEYFASLRARKTGSSKGVLGLWSALKDQIDTRM